MCRYDEAISGVFWKGEVQDDDQILICLHIHWYTQVRTFTYIHVAMDLLICIS